MKTWFSQGIHPNFPHGSAVTVGNFDGVHLGHRHILQRLKQEADNRHLPVVVVIFEPQPQEFFARKNHCRLPYRISPLRSKLELLKKKGFADTVWVLRFNQSFADMDAQTFINRILRSTLNTKYLLIGDDFRFGANRTGDFKLLQNQPGILTECTPSVLVDNIRASSTAIRQALSDGMLEYARKLLGHSYAVSGRIKHGSKLGRTIGCPTANVQLPQHRYPLNGVFVIEAESRFGKHHGVANFGFNPSVSASHCQKLEVHLFDFNGNLYGQRLNVHFLHKLRNEKKFEHIEDLKRQIQADIDAAHDWLQT